MCGIAGILKFDGGVVEAARLRTMLDLLKHRGPDADGMVLEGGIGIGHTRLSIIDLSGSPQPMQTPDGRFVLTFNGEIFNYRELRRCDTYNYLTSGDTEVVLSTIARHGPDAAERFIGQFAIAIHDRHTGDTWLIRDRAGVLPLYYYLDGQQLVFASEIKAVWAGLGRSVQLDKVQLRSYLTSRVVNAPNTLFAGIKKVPAGHYIRIDRRGNSAVQRYWSLPAPAEVLDVRPAEAIDLVERTITAAVEAALVADVPVGAYLSGGVDSSLIVALTRAVRRSRGNRDPISTFAAEFGDDRVDETPYSELIARMFRTDHHRVRIRPDTFQSMWGELTWYRDAPVSEPADIAVAQLATAARQHVKVVLSGEGSDELFGGYPKYRFARLTQMANCLPSAVRSRSMRSLERVVPAGMGRARIALRALSGVRQARMEDWFASFTQYECDQLLGDSVQLPRRSPAHRDAIDLMGRLDFDTWLADNLLERGDRMSMASSLELRPPFLDHRLIELAFRLPSSLKVHNGHTKWILKKVAQRHLPGAVVWRPKVGFKVPLDAWFRDDLENLARDLLQGPSSFVSSVADPRVVASLLDSHSRGRRNEEIRIWTLLSLEFWGRKVFGTATSRSTSSHPNAA